MNKTQHKNPLNLQPFFSIIFLFIAICLLNLPIMGTLWRHGFDDGTYSHAFLIPFIVIYLFFQLARNGKLQFRRKLSIPSIALLILSGTLLFVTTNAQISLGYWLAFLALAMSSIVLLFNFSWVTIFPVVFLIFIFPFWGGLVPFLQNLSVIAVSFIMGFTGIPTFVSAEFITIPAGVFEIAGGCSGLRYFIVSLAIGSLFIFLYIKSGKKALLFLSIAILGALFTNWIRITALIVIGDYTNMESSLMEDHNTFGWYIYLPFMFLLFKLGNKLADTDILATNSKAVVNAKPTLITIGFLLFVLVLSSTTINSLINSTTSVQSTNTAHSSSILPRVYFYSGIIKQPLPEPNNTYQIYHFDGSNLDGKPSFYANNMLPNGHQIIDTDIANGWNIYYVRSNGGKSAILFKYEIDHTTYTNLLTFKLARLKKSLLNINNTKLHWVYLNCKNNCENTINNFIISNN